MAVGTWRGLFAASGLVSLTIACAPLPSKSPVAPLPVPAQSTPPVPPVPSGAVASIGHGSSSAAVPVANAPAPTHDSSARPLAEPERARIVPSLSGHTAAVRRLSVSLDSKVLLTAAEDKSARTWDVETGKLRQTIRPATGAGRAGLLYGAAIHPVDPVGAVAGNVLFPLPGGFGSSNSANEVRAAQRSRIVLFELLSGTYQRSIVANSGEIKDLAWSPDGSILYAVTAMPHAFLAFDRGGRTLWQQRYSGPLYGLAASADGRVAAASFDGTVTLATGRASRITDTLNIRVGQKRPDGLAFSPDGKELVVGFHRAKTAPELYDSVDGRFITRLPMPRITAGAINRVAYSRDGARIVAAGRAYIGKAQRVPVFWYDAQQRTLLGNRVIARNSVLDLEPLPNRRFAFGSFDGRVGVFGDNGLQWSVDSPLVQVGNPDHLWVSDTGDRVSWRALDERRLSFGFPDRRMNIPTLGLRPPKTKRSLFDNARWRNSRNPVINGRAISLAASEIGRAISYTRRDGNDAFFGTSQRLMRIAADGDIQWSIATLGEVRAVNTTAGDRMVISAMSNGTIQWRRAVDGALLLTLLGGSEGKWVAWLPTGHFDAGVGGDRIAGWTINSEKEPIADFHLLGQIRLAYHNAAVIDRIFDTLDAELAVKRSVRLAGGTGSVTSNAVELKTLAQAAAEPVVLPPTFDKTQTGMVSYADGKVVFPFAIQPSGDALQIVLVAGGRRVKEATVQFTGPAGQSPQGELKRGVVTATAPTELTRYQLIALSSHGNSMPVDISYDPPAPLAVPAAAVPAAGVASGVNAPSTDLPATAPVGQPADARPVIQAADKQPVRRNARLYVLAVGVANYRNPAYKLEFAAKDARDFTAEWQRQSLSLYRSARVRVLTDEEATKPNIIESLHWLRDNVQDNDVVAVFFAGHGVNDSNGTYHYLPYEADATDLAGTSVSESVLRDALVDLRGKVLMFVDTCYGGAVLSRQASYELSRLANNLSSPENGVIVFAASEGRQLSEESETWRNGAFTAALLKGLSGEASFDRGYITVKSLDLFISDEVKRLTEGRQTPVSISPSGVPDFVLVKLSGAS